MRQSATPALPQLKHNHPLRLKQRQGDAGASPMNLGQLISNNEMLKMAIQEVSGSNIPLVASASTPDEMVDQAVLQSSETINAFGFTVLLNLAMLKGIDHLAKEWIPKGEAALTRDQQMWRRFTASMPTYAWLVGFEFLSPLVRNMITLHRTQELDFSKITDVQAKKHNGKDSAEYKAYVAKREIHKQTPNHQRLVKERMKEYKQLAIRDYLITLPVMAATTAVGLMGIRKNWAMPALHLDTPKL